jgi:putative tricarboxylic transport membrane protein
LAKHDRVSSLFWIGIALAICIESLRLGPGSLSNPGAGLVPLGCGLILGIFGAIVFVLSFKKVREAGEPLWKFGTRWGKMIAIAVSITAYTFLIDILGFHMVTFFWMIYVCWGIGEVRWKSAILVSIITTFSSYLLFEHYLHINFPRGLLRF